MIFCAFLIAAAVVIIFVLCCREQDDQKNDKGKTGVRRKRSIALSEKERYGKQGEMEVSRLIESVMADSDRLVRNVEVTYEGKRAEIDNIIISRNGVFIIEVKHYAGDLTGGADDDEWTKIKTTDAGNIYEDEVRNPIKQLNRQIFYLSRFLRAKGFDKAWIEGYVFLVDNASPIEDERILCDRDDIRRAISTRKKGGLTTAEVEDIYFLLSQ